MQQFPVGAFLFWKIEKDTAKEFQFFEFVREYHQRDAPHCPPLGSAPENSVTAILDGQQRLTAFNIGLRGSYTVKEPNKWWNNPKAFPTKKLHIDLLYDPTTVEEGMAYRFAFRTVGVTPNREDSEFWFPVTRVLDMPEIPNAMAFLAEHKLGNDEIAVRTLLRLYEAVHKDPTINFYEEESQEVERVLNIFIRTNSGGTVLSYSDLLLSIAVAQWKNHDARSEIHGLVDSLNDTGDGFDFSKDFVLKAGLMLSDIASVGFKVENFNRANMAKLEKSWSKVCDALQLTVQLASAFGLSRDTLYADSSLLPLAYYLYQRGSPANYLNSKLEAKDRDAIKHWLMRSLIKSGIWGSGLDVLLTALRGIIREHGKQVFPVASIEKEMSSRGKNLDFADEEIDDLVDMPYGSRQLFGLLTLLFPFVDTRNKFHIDHVFPRSAFHKRKLMKLGFDSEEAGQLQDFKERLPNLQLLEGPENQSKNDAMPNEWIASRYPTEEERSDFFSRAMLGDVMTDVTGFQAFYDTRRDRLRTAIVNVLNGPAATAETTT